MIKTNLGILFSLLIRGPRQEPSIIPKGCRAPIVKSEVSYKVSIVALSDGGLLAKVPDSIICCQMLWIAGSRAASTCRLTTESDGKIGKSAQEICAHGAFAFDLDNTTIDEGKFAGQ